MTNPDLTLSGLQVAGLQVYYILDIARSNTCTVNVAQPCGLSWHVWQISAASFEEHRYSLQSLRLRTPCEETESG